MRPDILTHWNRKYGLDVYVFTLPVSTCLHKTAACEKFCYGKRIWKNIRERYEQNYRDSLDPGFEDAVIGQVTSAGVKWVRLHTTGDFYSQEYFDKWIRIARACPGTRFLAYTRNRDIDARACPGNLVLYFSIDDTTPGCNPTIRRRAIAFDPPADVEFYRHMEPRDGARICSNRCVFCKACWSGRIDEIAFPIVRSAARNYHPPGDKYKMPWNLRRDNLYVPKGGFNKKPVTS